MIICTTPEQLKEWIKCQYFEIDLSFKRVAEEINEFEINYYNNEHNLSKYFIIIFKINNFINFINILLILILFFFSSYFCSSIY